MPDHLLQIGYVARAHGLRGELKVQLFDAASEALAHIKYIWLGPPSAAGDGSRPGPAGPAARSSARGAGPAGPQEPRRQRVQTLRALGEGLHLVTLDGLADRTAAEKLQGSAVYADRDELPQLDDAEYYVSDIVGDTVLLADGQPVGKVRAVLETASYSLMVVAREGRTDAMIPMVPEIVLSVDPSARSVVIDPPEGLLDINEPGDRGEAREGSEAEDRGEAEDAGSRGGIGELDGAGTV